LVSVAINIPISQSRKESRRSWIVFANAFTLSLETIFIESLTIFLGIPPITLAATSIPMAGGMLLLIVVFGMKRKLTIFRSWKYLLPGSVFIAIGIITWYDSVSRIGAAKESVLFGPIGTLAVLFLARFFLHERLSTLQLVGVIIAIFGFFLSVASAAVGSPLSWFSLGDLEVILSGIAFAAAIIYLTKLTRIHSSIEVAGGSLLISGVILATFQWIYSPIVPSVNDWLFLSLYSLFPLIGALFN
jgi:drug/metabolite transporter (DMT)-like permease